MIARKAGWLESATINDARSAMFEWRVALCDRLNAWVPPVVAMDSLLSSHPVCVLNVHAGLQVVSRANRDREVAA